MRKKLITLLTALAMLFTLMPAAAMAADTAAEQGAAEGASSTVRKNSVEEFDEAEVQPPHGFEAGEPAPAKKTTKAVSNSCGKNLKYKMSGNTLTISGTGAMTEFESEEAPWYSSRNHIYKVVIGNGCTTVGSFAFYNCANLSSVEIGNTVTQIGEAAFYKCPKLTAVDLKNVKVLNTAAFADCSKLSSITVNKLTTVNDYALQKTALKSFHIPATLKTLSGLAFFKCNIESITAATNNKTFSVKNGVVLTNGGKTLIMYPTGLPNTTFQIPNTVTKIEKHAVSNNKYLTEISIPNKVTYIGEGAFINAESLKTLTIGDGVKEMGDYPFFNCLALETVTFGSGLKETPYQCFSYCESLSKVNWGTALTTLGAHTFSYCNSLTEVDLPKNIQEIGVGAFGCCEGLKKFTSHGIKEYIPYQCFYGDVGLTEVNLNEGVDRIYRVAFIGCETLNAVTLPASVSFVDSDAFPVYTKITCKNRNMEKYGTNGYRYLESVKINVSKNYDYAEAVLKLVNQKRKAAGLNTLTMSESLTETAMKRAGECALLFSHTRPDGSSCFTANGNIIAENIAFGQTTPKEVMDSWMHSPGHKANILTKGVDTIGIGCVKHNGTYYWVQVFGTATSADKYTYPANKSVIQTAKICTEPFDEAMVGDDIIWGDYETYTYKMNMLVNNTVLPAGDSIIAKVRVSNPGASGLYAVLNNDGINWTSGNKTVATVSKGKITAIGAGKCTIKAKMKYYSPSKQITVKPKGTTISKITRGNDKMTVKWAKCTQQVTGYQIRYTTSTVFEHYKTVTIKNHKTTKTTLESLKAGKKYFVKIRTYKTVNGVKYYSAWSKVKTVAAR